MKKVAIVIALLVAQLWAAPVYQTGTGAATTGTTNTTGTITLSSGTLPVTGNRLVFCLSTSLAVTGISVQDNSGTPVTLTAGSSFLTSGPNTAIFYYTVPSPAPTAYTATWTTSRAFSIAVAQYAGDSGVTGSPTGGTANGNSTALSISPTANESGDFAVGCFSRSAGTTLTANVGNLRAENHAGTVDVGLADATSTGATATNVALTAGSTGTWSVSALILRTAGSSTVPNQYPRVQ